MGNGLHLTLVQMEGGLQQRLAVARGAGAPDSDPGGQLFGQQRKGVLGGFHGIALIVGVVEEQQLALVANEGDCSPIRTSLVVVEPASMPR